MWPSSTGSTASSQAPRKLFTQIGDAKDSPWRCAELGTIGPTLSTGTDASQAKALRANQEPKCVYQGQNPVSEGFFLTPEEAGALLRKDPLCQEVIFPYMIGRDLVADGRPTRWIIDFGQREMTEAMRYKPAFARVKELVMPDVLAKAEKEKAATGKNSTRWTRMANRWWQFRDYQPGTMAAIAGLPRYITCARVTKRPIFEFISSAIHPDNMLIVFPFADDYSFGILQSGIHWAWFKARCSTLKGDFRYTS
ncbi:MAG TPA: type IIL restriction-modification enzyme MmeI, partial [Candidatus Acidoferrum sp.]|nr:type IIL restriction-modification enzyme MmeI [Candidatus Acidoferrum sp.]